VRSQVSRSERSSRRTRRAGRHGKQHLLDAAGRDQQWHGEQVGARAAWFQIEGAEPFDVGCKRHKSAAALGRLLLQAILER
jgi:hypothetical protein